MQRPSPIRRRAVAIALARHRPALQPEATEWLVAGVGLALLLAALAS